MSLGNFINRIKNRALIEADAMIWARSIKNIQRSDWPVPTGCVLFCDLLSMIASAKVQALYAASLRLKGFQSVILMRGRSPTYEKLYQSALPDVRFIYLEDHLVDVSKAEVEDMLQGLNSAQDVLSLEINGCRVGKNALSYAVRQLRVGTLNLDDPRHRKCFSDILQESLALSRMAGRLIEDISPQLAVFLERGYTPAGEIFDACIEKGVRTVQWLGAPQSDSLLFKAYNRKNKSVHPLSLGDETWAHICSDAFGWDETLQKTVIDKLQSHYYSGSWFNRQQLQTGKSIQTKDEVLGKLGLDPNKKTAVVFSHIFYDATFFYGESIYPDYRQWLVETIRYAIENKNLNWIVKVHPVNVWRSAMDGVAMEQLEAAALEEEFGPLPNHIKIMAADTDVNTFSLFHFIDYGLTVRGTIGMELPCFGIPVVTAGSGRYNGRGFTIDANTVNEYKEVLLTLHQRDRLEEKTVESACRYAYGTFFKRPVKMDSYVLDFHANTFKSKLFVQNTNVNSQYMQNWPKVDDLSRIADWMISDQEELLCAHEMGDKV